MTFAVLSKDDTVIRIPRRKDAALPVVLEALRAIAKPEPTLDGKSWQAQHFAFGLDEFAEASDDDRWSAIKILRYLADPLKLESELTTLLSRHFSATDRTLLAAAMLRKAMGAKGRRGERGAAHEAARVAAALGDLDAPDAARALDVLSALPEARLGSREPLRHAIARLAIHTLEVSELAGLASRLLLVVSEKTAPATAAAASEPALLRVQGREKD